MTKKNSYLLLLAVTAMTFTACSSDDYNGVTEPQAIGDETPITFAGSRGNASRAEQTGAPAATLLGNAFVVEGVKTVTSGDQVVFNDYTVEYTENSGGNSPSNSSGWEYVGKGNNQTIKYWDASATSYSFVAYSKGGKTMTATAIDNTKLGTSSSEAAFTVTGTMDNLQNLFLSKVKTITVTSPITSQPDAVSLTFKRPTTNVVIGLYETIPGYSVKNVRFYQSAEATIAGGGTSQNNPYLYGSAAQFYAANQNVTISVVYSSIGNDAEPTVTYSSATMVKYLTGGEITTSNGIGTSSTDCTEAKPVAVVPNTTNSEQKQYAGDLTLKVDYTLVSDDTNSNETIEITGATAVIPSAYTSWQANHIYTYIFKITNATSQLFPITFDAMVDVDETNEQETITTVAKDAPSITTYQEGTIDTNEYVAGTQIDVTLTNLPENATVTSENFKLYTAVATSNNGVPTESACLNALKNTELKADGVTLSASSWTVNTSTPKASFTPDIAGYYVAVYSYTVTEGAETVTKYVCKVIKVLGGEMTATQGENTEIVTGSEVTVTLDGGSLSADNCKLFTATATNNAQITEAACLAAFVAKDYTANDVTLAAVADALTVDTTNKTATFTPSTAGTYVVIYSPNSADHGFDECIIITVAEAANE